MPATGTTTLPTTGLDTAHLVCGDAPLDVAETTFRLLTTGPEPLTVDGGALGHSLPRRPIVLRELASVLMHPSCGYLASDAAWRLLVDRARTAGPAWVIGAVGVALPGLRSASWRLNRTFTGDVQAELLAAFVTALTGVDTAEPRVAQRLCSTALVAARARLRAVEPARVEVTVRTVVSAPPPAPGGHPDFVLARAVRAGVISALEAELIGATRLEDIPIAEYATRAGLSRWAAYKTRARAEERLVAAIRTGSLDDDTASVVTEATTTVAFDPWAGR
ncbi:MAG: hypothetical protein HKP61_05445 [Dactylosporangium sp.]|nr:hypothetical protein [Dactylosporangium sp.]NNJ60391.1 hypothetical protein [Dactylosporangium sp.]